MGLDLINRVSDELWMEVHDVVQEEGIKIIPKKKKCKKAKWLSEKASQRAMKCIYTMYIQTYMCITESFCCKQKLSQHCILQ